MIDIGVNLADKRFAADRDAVVERARAAGVSAMVLTGTRLATSRAVAALAAGRPGVLYATAGVHPHDAKSVDGETAGALRALAARPEVVAIGECGLDYDRDFSPRPAQREAFAMQLGLAVELGMPTFLHARAAHADLCRIIADHPEVDGVVHCFTGGPAEAEAYLALGLHIGVTGWICDDRRADELRAAVRHIPLDRLMLETDAPYLTPRDLRPKPKGGRNEPALLPHVA
ncbi:MAG: TatD family hydrolase, partial [bacterium]